MPVYNVKPQLSGSAPTPTGSTKKAVAYINDGYPYSLTFECDDTSVATYADLVDYLKSKGYTEVGTTDSYHFPTLICSCAGYPDTTEVINNIFVGLILDSETREVEAIKVNGGVMGENIPLDVSIEISFLD